MKTKICKPFYNFCLIFIILFSNWTVINVNAQRTRDLVQEDTKDNKKQKRLALVIGNGSYKTSPLRNPVNDANDMAAALKLVGFEVILHTDINQNKMKRAMSDFGKKLRTGGGTGLFYFAGHGVQVRGKNYLIPIGAKVDTEEEVEFEGVDVGRLLAQLRSARNGLNIVILDACRNNPFARSYRSGDKGLASIDAPSGTIIAYATAPGSVASDGTGRNGLYTQELLKQIKTPGLSIESAFKRVRVEVRSKTDSKQTPWESSSLTGDFYFAGNKNGNQAPPSANTTVPTKSTPILRAGMIRKNAIGMDLVYIPSGSFMMGSPASEVKRDKDEGPQRRVRIEEGFWMGKYEVTQQEYEQVMGTNPSNFSGCPKCPVEKVSWNDTKEFIRKLNAKDDGFRYSLPTEAEWEYSARAGTTTAFAFGNSLDSSQANFDGNYPYGGASKGSYLEKTAAVGSYQANNWGLYDMHGNVWEWVEDIYNKDGYRGLPVDGSANIMSMGDPGKRVLRGGSWSDFGYSLRSAVRGWVSPSGRYYVIGFRVAARPSTL